jgi:hypothetical protein
MVGTSVAGKIYFYFIIKVVGEVGLEPTKA